MCPGKRRLKALVAITLLGPLVACAGPRPVLSWNEAMRTQGREAATLAIDQCLRQAGQLKRENTNLLKGLLYFAGAVAFAAASISDQSDADDDGRECGSPERGPTVPQQNWRCGTHLDETATGNRSSESRGNAFCSHSVCSVEGYRSWVTACLREKGYQISVWR
jgi:hypothetical protein